MLKKRILYNDEMQPEVYIDEEGIYEYKVSTSENFDVYKKISEINYEHIKRVKILSVFEKNFVYAEKYVFGKTLTELLAQNEDLSQHHAQKMIHELISAIEILHEKKIIHRDIKPDNIVISELGSLVLIDFNISRLYKEFQENDTTLFGTKGYAPPEQFGFAQTNSKADYYALGKVIKLIAKKSDLDLTKVVEKCTDFNPENRYQNINDIRQDIDKYINLKKPTRSKKELKLALEFIWPDYDTWSLLKKSINWLELFIFALFVIAYIGVIVEQTSPSTLIELVLVAGYIIAMLYVALQSMRNDKIKTKYLKTFGLYFVVGVIFTMLHDMFKIFN